MAKTEIDITVARGVHNKKAFFEKILAGVGVQIGGRGPVDVQVHDERAYARVIRDGMLGAGESYMEGWWDCNALDKLTSRMLRTDLLGQVGNNMWLWIALKIKGLMNLQRGARSRDVADVHYNLSNEFFENMLGQTMAYSCGYWRTADDLDQAQRDKHNLVCRKLDLQPEDRVLDIGCGWGSFAQYAAAEIGCQVTGITIASEQAEYARKLCSGLPVDILLMDYRSRDLRASGPFDKIVSIGMFEHVGARNFGGFMQLVSEMLMPAGLFLLHTIGKTDHMPALWMNRYIFPNSDLPTMMEISGAADSHVVLEDLHNFGVDYDRTLMSWYHNFATASKYPHQRYDDRFYRMWRFYLLTAAASFRNRKLQLWQCVFSKDGLPGGYVSIR